MDALRQMSMSRRCEAEVPVTPARGVPARCTIGCSDRVKTPGDVSAKSTKKLKKLDEFFTPGEK
jgi:hypothetical protein